MIEYSQFLYRTGHLHHKLQSALFRQVTRSGRLGNNTTTGSIEGERARGSHKGNILDIFTSGHEEIYIPEITDNNKL